MNCGHRIFMKMILCLFALTLSGTLLAQKKEVKQKEKIYIERANVVRHNQFQLPDIQIAKGNVKFRYKDFTLLCDSAYINEKQNSFSAFGNVDLKRTDGTHLTCSRLYYEGMIQVARAREKVILRQPRKSLRCDSLDYNMGTNLANYFGGRGTLVYDGSTVVADQGDYNTQTKDANFMGNVVIRTPKYTINTPSAQGNTDTGLMRVIGKSVIRTAKGEVVHTEDGTYNSKTDYMELKGRSNITSPDRDVEGDNLVYNSVSGEAEGYGNVKIKDKKNNRTMEGEEVRYNDKTGHSEGTGKVKIVDHKARRTITGDHVIYNFKTGHSEGHGKVKIVDALNQRVITGDDLFYNDKTREGEGKGNVYYIDHKKKHAFQGAYVSYTDSAAIAYGGNPGAVLKEFSQADTLFMHADTLSMKAFHLNTPQEYRKIFGVNNVRVYREDLQAVCGLMVYHTGDSCLTLYYEPILWNENRQVVGDSIQAYMNDSTIHRAYVYDNASSIEKVDEQAHFNQVYSKRINAFFTDGKLKKAEAVGNVLIVYYPKEEKDSTLMGLNYTETDTLRMYMAGDKTLDRIWLSKSTGTMYPMSKIPSDKLKLPAFAWYEHVRPKNKYDLFRRVGRRSKE